MKVSRVCCALLLTGLMVIDAKPHHQKADKDETRYMHSRAIKRTKRGTNNDRSHENSSEYWRQQAQKALNEKLHQKMNTNVAKNVILFLGDGMSLPTLAAARIYMGQQNGKPGEESVLSFEEFPYTGLSKTYCIDSQVADSACSSTAYLCGIKANIGTIGVNGNVVQGDWRQGINDTNKVTSIGHWSQLKNKRTGIVTTTRVTHASPSGVYANTGDRDWESDFDIIEAALDPEQVTDIATQLIRGEVGKKFNVILGGGREKFLPLEVTDEEGDAGERMDGVDLIKEWQDKKKDQNGEYVWNRDQLLNVNDDTNYLLGLFESSHCNYNLDRTDADPSLVEMVEAAIKILSKGKNGFFLFVEGGRIDHAHHDTRAQKALDETAEFSKAVKRAYELTNEDDTLIVVTSDHAHTMSLSGYADRGNDILGAAGTADDALPYATLAYANGPGYRHEEEGKRHDLSDDNTHGLKYEFPAIAPLDSETHGGDDVGIFANGPWAHLFRGVIQQNVIPHIIAYASCVGDGITVCDNVKTFF